MNKIFLLIGMFLLVMGLSLTSVHAAEVSAAVNVTNPVVTPDHPVQYFFHNMFGKIKLFVTTNETQKADLHLKFAEEKIQAMQLMMQENKTQYTEKLMNEYQEHMNKCHSEVLKMKGLGMNTTKLEQHIQKMTQKHIKVLEEVEEKAHNHERLAIQKALNNTIRQQERINTSLERMNEMRCGNENVC